jgi:hypothetical protein
MSTNGGERTSTTHALGDRRWLIGIGISVVFGLFSGVMALLSYFAGAEPTAPPAPRAPAARGAAEPARHGKTRGERNR